MQTGEGREWRTDETSGEVDQTDGGGLPHPRGLSSSLLSSVSHLTANKKISNFQQFCRFPRGLNPIR